MATITKGTTFASGDVVTPAKLNNLVDAATVTNIQTADIADSQITTAKIADANVTSAKLAAVTQQALIPVGAVMPFAMSTAPSGWFVANGAPVSRTTYATLFAAIGTLYGTGDGSTTFNLPDLRGYFVRGSGTNNDGTAAGNFGTKQADGLESHTHTGSTASAGSHTHTISGWTTDDGGGAYVAGSPTAGTTRNISTAGAHTHTVTIDATGTTETRPANIAMLYCIKF